MANSSDESVMNKDSVQPATRESGAPSTRSSTLGPLLPARPVFHHPKAGLNPIVDAAATLFSIMGRLKQVHHYRQLGKLQQELVQEIQHFQTSAKAQGYSSEHVLVSRYALCATLDDLIQQSRWGSEGQWEPYSLLMNFHPDSSSQDRFFIILERLIKEPALYIDILELMYLCLSFGFQGPYRGGLHQQPASYFQLEQIIQGLYQQIRAYRGDFPKNLSPFLLKPNQPPKPSKRAPSLGWTLLLTSCFILVIMSGLGYSLGTMITQLNQDLIQLGKANSYETHA